MEFETPVLCSDGLNRVVYQIKYLKSILLSIESQLETLIDVLDIIDIDIVYNIYHILVTIPSDVVAR